MAAAAERMRALRARRRSSALREIRLLVPDSNSPTVRQEAARQAASLNPADEAETMAFLEAVTALDQDAW